MTRDLFRRYVWLVDTVRHGHKMTFGEISELWDHSPLNDEKSPLALRTFHNHREAIEILFGIRILCDRSTHNYFIPEDPTGLTDLKVWMLQTLSVSHILRREADDVENRVLFDESPEERFSLFSLIDAMKLNRVVTFDCRDNELATDISYAVEPYCIRYLGNSWYLLGRDLQSFTLRTFNVEQMFNLRISRTRFKYPEEFSPRHYFSNFFSINVETKEPVQTIVIRARSSEREKLIANPLHRSQKEIFHDRRFSTFQYEFAPDETFVDAMIAQAATLEVLEPEPVRIKIKQRLHEILEMYTNTDAETKLFQFQQKEA